MWKSWKEEKNTMFCVRVTEGYESGPLNNTLKGLVLKTGLNYYYFFRRLISSDS